MTGTSFFIPPEVGDWPTWIGTISATGALIFAALTWRREQARDAARELEQQRAQADLIAALPTRAEVPISIPASEVADRDIVVALLEDGVDSILHVKGIAPAVSVVNHSNLSIYDAEITFPEPSHIGHVHPHSERSGTFSLALLDQDGTGLGADHRADARTATGRRDLPTYDALGAWELAGRCAIAFTDAGNRRWTRKTDGTLELLHETPGKRVRKRLRKSR